MILSGKGDSGSGSHTGALGLFKVGMLNGWDIIPAKGNSAIDFYVEP